MWEGNRQTERELQPIADGKFVVIVFSSNFEHRLPPTTVLLSKIARCQAIIYIRAIDLFQIECIIGIWTEQQQRKSAHIEGKPIKTFRAHFPVWFGFFIQTIYLYNARILDALNSINA